MGSKVVRITHIVKMLAKPALPFQGHRNESTYTLFNEALNRANVLAIVQLVKQYDPSMAARGPAV